MAEEEQAAAGEGGETAPSSEAEETFLSDEEARTSLEGYGDVRVDVSAVLGTVHMPIGQFLKLSQGAIIALDRHRDEHIDININGQFVTKGDITIIGEKIGVTITGNEPIAEEIDEMAAAMAEGG